MKTPLLAAAAAALAIAPPAFAQSAQEQLDARYDRALAAGYKALFLCSAIANAERAGTKRTEQRVLDWELSGIQSPLAAIVSELDYTIFRYDNGEGPISHVTIDWSREMPPRMAWHREEGGCALATLGMAKPPKVASVGYSDGIYMWSQRIPTNRKLARVVERSFESRYGDDTRTTAVIVDALGEQRMQRFIDEFGPVTPQRTWSVAKSIAATLVGAAVHRGEADVSASAGLGVDGNDPRRAITIDHLLRMASGRYSDTPGNRTDPLYFGGSTVEETALHWPLIHEPNTVYRYANNDTLAAIMAIDSTFKEHPPADFFAKVGMYHTVAETDWQGDYILSSQVWSTARDLAKLGQLYLDDGVLPDGTRILPEGWVEYVSSPSGPQPEGRSWGYGAGFWLFNQHEGIPKDTFFAAGNRGQYIVIVPSMNVVIVRRGEDPTGTRFDIEAFTRDVLESLEK